MDPPVSLANRNDLGLVGPVITHFGFVKRIPYPENLPVFRDCGYVEPVGLNIECSPSRGVTEALRARKA